MQPAMEVSIAGRENYELRPQTTNNEAYVYESVIVVSRIIFGSDEGPPGITKSRRYVIVA